MATQKLIVPPPPPSAKVRGKCNRGLLIKTIQVALLTLGIVFVSLALPVSAKETTELAHIEKHEVQQKQPIKANEPHQPLPEAKPVADKGITGRVFCGSPKQRTWKNIDVHNATLGKGLASDKGWSGNEWTALVELWACESSWGHLKANYEGSGAYGVPQSLPASKMASHGEDYLTNPVTQIKWGLDYIANRYGSPSKALEFHYAKNWY